VEIFFALWIYFLFGYLTSNDNDGPDFKVHLDESDKEDDVCLAKEHH